MSRITFRKLPLYNGMARRAEALRVSRDGKEIATIQRDIGGDWFWYGSGYNSLWNGKPKSLEECKDEVRTHFSK